ncbi:MAG: hypothetical protein JW819_05285 [Candidatus Krumholzibacteriota bacterium]|nr:hypothetical protein [Candidatus Krumholzibacteriota bacterium]
MSAAKRLTKRQLKDDKFVDAMLSYGELARKYQRHLLYGILVIILVILGLTWGANYRRAQGEEAQHAFSTALKTLETAMTSAAETDYAVAQAAFEDVHARYGGRQVGKWSLYFTGFCKERVMDYIAAQADYERYLEEDPRGEFEIPARAGIAVCLGSVGKMKQEADILRDLAGRKGIGTKQAQAWLYQASQIYLDEGYFSVARELLEELATGADPTLARKIEQDLEALKSLGS